MSKKNKIERQKTGGGTFDPKEEHVYFIAAGAQHLVSAADLHQYLLIATNEINTERDIEWVQGAIDAGKKVFLDSGVFELAMRHAEKRGWSYDQGLNTPPQEIDGFDKLVEKYISLVKRLGSGLWGYVEIDLGGRENKIKTRAMLESAGLNPIPVYHPFGDGWDYFDYLAQRYDRICFGNTVQATGVVRKRLLATAYERKKQYPDLWIHLLGLTPNQWLNAYPINSADSSTWISGLRWSGDKPCVALAPFGELPLNFRYQLGSSYYSDQYQRGIRMGAYSSYMNLRNWRQHINTLESLGIYPYDQNQDPS